MHTTALPHLNSGTAVHSAGGIISPLLYIVYVADLDLWLKYSIIITYADDTSSSIKGKVLRELIRIMKEDAENLLKFMAANGLVANLLPI